MNEQELSKAVKDAQQELRKDRRELREALHGHSATPPSDRRGLRNSMQTPPMQATG